MCKIVHGTALLYSTVLNHVYWIDVKRDTSGKTMWAAVPRERIFRRPQVPTRKVSRRQERRSISMRTSRFRAMGTTARNCRLGQLWTRVYQKGPYPDTEYLGRNRERIY